MHDRTRGDLDQDHHRSQSKSQSRSQSRSRSASPNRSDTLLGRCSNTRNKEQSLFTIDNSVLLTRRSLIRRKSLPSIAERGSSLSADQSRSPSPTTRRKLFSEQSNPVRQRFVGGNICVDDEFAESIEQSAHEFALKISPTVTAAPVQTMSSSSRALFEATEETINRISASHGLTL